MRVIDRYGREKQQFSSMLMSGQNITLVSGQIISGVIANNAVVSGSIASGQIGTNHLASGVLQNFILTSGIVTSGDVANNAVVSGSVASGQIGQYHLSPGTSFEPERQTTTTDDVITTIATIPLSDNTTYFISAYIVAREFDGGSGQSSGRGGYHRKVIVYRENGGPAVILGAVDTSLTRETDAEWNASMSVDNNDLLITVQGSVDRQINWRAKFLIVDVT